MLDRIYLEITNICNFDCTFCHKTSRKKTMMSEGEFFTLLEKIDGKARYLYLHLMGEPTLHPLLPLFIKTAREKGFLPAITTNGSLLEKTGDAIICALPYKVSISLHAPEANDAFADESYLESCVKFAKKAAAQGIYVALRLWNVGSGADNSKTLEFLHGAFEGEWRDIRAGSSQRMSERIFLEWGERFEWPDPLLPQCDPDEDRFCYGLRDQIGILADGTVVPCCLDSDGNLALGNLFESELDEIIASPRARAIYDGFTRRRAVEPLCRGCGYIKRFIKNALRS